MGADRQRGNTEIAELQEAATILRAAGKGKRFCYQNLEAQRRGSVELGPRPGACLSELVSLGAQRRDSNWDSDLCGEEASWPGLTSMR